MAINLETYNWPRWEQEISTSECSTLKGTFTSLPFLPNLQNDILRGDRKNLVVQSSRWHKRNTMSWTHQDSCTYKITLVVTACARSYKVKPDQIPKGTGRYRWSPLVEELLAIDNNCDRNIDIFCLVCGEFNHTHNATYQENMNSKGILEFLKILLLFLMWF